ncbi:MAG: hypothetical protein OER04_11975 [Cyclobacteriaceae bacterium]|nr:hypothetical protein [Cyclobacteriaceae bacterium]
MTKRFFILSILIFSLSQVSIAKDIVVTNTRDAGAGSLREAIIIANCKPGTDKIKFNIPMADQGFLPGSVTGEQGWAFFIRLQQELPEITDPLIMDGYSQTLFTGNTNHPEAGKTKGAEVVIYFHKNVKKVLPREMVKASTDRNLDQMLWLEQVEVSNANNSRKIFNAEGGRVSMR